MTAVFLFDTLSNGGSARQAGLAEKLVASSLNDLDRISDYERTSINPVGESPARVQQSIHALYSQWADESEQVLQRVRTLASTPATLVTLARQLQDAVGRLWARLSVVPDQQIAAAKQAKDGEFIPAEGLRNELRSRLRA